MMNNMYLIILSLFALTSCGETAKSDVSKKTTDKPKTEQTIVNDGIPYVNGLSEKNKGDKSGKIALSGQINKSQPGQTVYLYATEGKINTLIDSAKIENMNFDFGTQNYDLGYYGLALDKETNMTYFILNPDEKKVDLNFAGLRMDNYMTSPNSVENQAYAEYRTIELGVENEISRLKSTRANSSMKEKYTKMIEDKQDELIIQRNALIEKYPDTYFAKIMTWMRSPNHDNKSTYWDDIDFTDVSLIRSMAMNDRIQDFMLTHSGATESGFLNCIDLLVEKSKENEKIMEYTLYTLLDGFYSSNKEDICLYIMDNYIFGEACGDVEISNVLKQRAAGVKSLQVGNIPPNFTIEKWNGGNLTLMKEVAKNKYTLVMFWSSWCHKCEQEIPVLQDFYQQYHPKGFEVVGVSVDMSRSAWVKAIEDRSITWPNVSQLNAWKSPVAQDYHVSSTPVLFLLNQKGEIVLKPKRVHEVATYLGQNLK